MGMRSELPDEYGCKLKEAKAKFDKNLKKIMKKADKKKSFIRPQLFAVDK